jgi:beta-galactosidase
MPPTITTQPQSQTVPQGQPATFTVAASGTPTLNYQWMENGMAISAGTSASYTTPPTTPNDNNTQFAVVVSNSSGSVTSTSATLRVLLVP